MLFDVQRIAHAYCVTPDQVRQALNRLTAAGKIIRTDNLGNPVKNIDPPTHKRLIKLVIDSGGTLPWDKPHRLGIAKMLGVKLSTLRRNKYTVDHLLHTELDGNDRPLQIMILDECAAIQYIEDETLTPTQRYQCHYYKYVTGYTQTRPKKVKPPKPPVRTLGHTICEYILSKGVVALGTNAQHIKALGCHRTSYQNAIKSLSQKGLINKTPLQLEIRDAAAVALFLAPFAKTDEKKPSNRNLPPSGLPRQKQGIRESVTNVTASDSTLSPQAKAAAKMILTSLLVRRSLEYQIAVTKLRLPRNYEPRQERLMSLYKEVKIRDEMDDDARRRQQGAMYAKQKAICIAIISAVQQYTELIGSVPDALGAEAVRRVESILPTIDNPDMDLGNQLVDWVEDVLPVDSDELNWVQQFIDNAKIETVGEFVCRGGIEFMLRCMEWTNLEDDTCIKQRVAWDIILYLCRTQAVGYNEKYPDQWLTITQMDGVGRQETYANGEAVAEALCRYWDMGYKTKSLIKLKTKILDALTAPFPRKTEDDEVVFTTALEIRDMDLGSFDESDLLYDWEIEQNATEPQKQDKRASTRYSLNWFQSKYKDIKDYGLPGDVEAISRKIGALLRWNNSSEEQQRTALVPMLNTPDRYSDPQLSWEQWDALVRNGRIFIP